MGETLKSVYQTHIPASSGGDYLKLKDGQKVKLRIMSEPTISVYKAGDRPRYGWVVWNHTDQKAQFYITGISVYQQVANLVEDWGDPLSFDITIKREGAGMNDTSYSVAPVKNATEITLEQVALCDEKDIVAGSKGKWLADYDKDGILPPPAEGAAVTSDHGQADQEQDV